MKHASHPGIVWRLRRAEGHLARVIAMIEEGRPCVDLAQQLQAVESALTKAKREMIHDHILHCLDAEGPDAAAAIRELKEIPRSL